MRVARGSREGGERLYSDLILPDLTLTLTLTPSPPHPHPHPHPSHPPHHRTLSHLTCTLTCPLPPLHHTSSHLPRCVGSPLFLKDHFSTGYSLALTKIVAGTFDTAALLEWAKGYVPAAALIGETSLELTLRLPGDDLGAFQRLFEALEPRLHELGVRDYGATCTTLEDVFLKINENSLLRLETKQAARAKQEAEMAGSVAGSSFGLVPDAEAAEAAAAVDSGEARSPLAARQPRSDGAKAKPPDAMAPARLFYGLTVKRVLSARRDCCTTCCMIFFPVVLVFFALALLGRASALVDTPGRMPLTPNTTFPSARPFIPRPVPLLIPEGNKAATAWSVQLEALGWAPNQGAVPGDSTTFPNVCMNLSDELLASPSSIMPAALAYSPATPIPGFLGPVAEVDVVSLMFNSSSIFAMPAMVDSMYATLIALASGDTVHLEGSMRALPLSNKIKGQISTFISLFASIMILIPFAFVAAQFIQPLVRERESGSKGMQFISGVRPLIYWLSNWVWDLMLYLLIELCVLVVFIQQKRDEFTGSSEALAGTALLLLLFGFAVVPLASFASFRFSTPSSGLIVMIAFYFLTGFGLTIADFIMQSVGGNTAKINKDLRNLYRLLPAYWYAPHGLPPSLSCTPARRAPLKGEHSSLL